MEFILTKVFPECLVHEFLHTGFMDPILCVVVKSYHFVFTCDDVLLALSTSLSVPSGKRFHDGWPASLSRSWPICLMTVLRVKPTRS